MQSERIIKIGSNLPVIVKIKVVTCCGWC